MYTPFSLYVFLLNEQKCFKYHIQLCFYFKSTPKSPIWFPTYLHCSSFNNRVIGDKREISQLPCATEDASSQNADKPISFNIQATILLRNLDNIHLRIRIRKPNCCDIKPHFKTNDFRKREFVYSEMLHTI